jgi:hypothetical protein
MSTPILTMLDLRAVLEAFLRDMPERLAQHQQTARLALDMERLGLLGHLDSRFSLAVVGEMNAGKSTLVNALIGQALAPTGVLATTATVNRLRHGSEAESRTFRVHWQDGAQSDLPIAQIGAFVAGQGQADRTRWLDLFAPVEFLRRVELVDTPGTGSAEATHGARTRAFLQSRDWGSRADALVCVLTPRALRHREGGDAPELLALFGEASRLAGASDANSIAVIQRWEGLPDPLAERDRLIGTARRLLAGKVGEVRAVSGMLGLASHAVAPATWQRVAALACDSKDEAIEEMLADPSLFAGDLPGAALPPAARVALRGEVSWPALQCALRLARSRRLRDGAALADELRKISGIDDLRSLIEARFGLATELVRAGTILRRLRDPCARAMLTLRDAEEALRREVTEKQQRWRPLIERQDAAPAGIGTDLAAILDQRQHDFAAVAVSHQALDQALHGLREAVEGLDGDRDGLSLLATLPATALTAAERAELHRLLGGAGMALEARLGRAVQPRQEAIEHAAARMGAWQARRRGGGVDERRLAEHASARYEQIVSLLEHAAAGWPG